MDLIQESFQRLFPDKVFSYQTKMGYNRRLSDFNANVRLHKNIIQINLNLQWKDIDDEIKIGLIQSLLLKVFKKKTSTPCIELYNNFIKNIPILIEKTECDPLLKDSFVRVNKIFFLEELEKPNLKWGRNAFRKLASYNFHDDTITVSTIFKNARQEVLDYLMYHELLHKHHKFKNKNGRSFFHTSAFKADERKYPYQKEIEIEISGIIKVERKNRIPKRKGLFDYFLS